MHSGGFPPASKVQFTVSNRGRGTAALVGCPSGRGSACTRCSARGSRRAQSRGCSAQRARSLAVPAGQLTAEPSVRSHRCGASLLEHEAAAAALQHVPRAALLQRGLPASTRTGARATVGSAFCWRRRERRRRWWKKQRRRRWKKQRRRALRRRAAAEPCRRALACAAPLAQSIVPAQSFAQPCNSCNHALRNARSGGVAVHVEPARVPLGALPPPPLPLFSRGFETASRAPQHQHFSLAHPRVRQLLGAVGSCRPPRLAHTGVGGGICALSVVRLST